MSKIVLSYAANFWSPGENPKDGIGLVSSRIFEAIRSQYPNSEIVFIDHTDFAAARKLGKIEHFFGISVNFHKLYRILKPSKATLITVNEHPLLRRTIKKISKSNGFGAKYLDGLDGIFSNLRESKYPHNVIAFGSWNSFASYEIAGFNPQNIIPIGWNYWDDFYSIFNDSLGNDILVFMGAICNRKGVGKLEQIIEYLAETHPEFRLKLVGFTSNESWRHYIEELESQFPSNFCWLRERIEYGSHNWSELRRGVSFSIFPSFEEGLAGCAMDVINLGVPLIHTSKTGIEISHRSLLDFDFEKDQWRDALTKVITGGPKLWKEIFEAQSNAAFFQNPSNDSICEAVQRSKNEDMWPALEFLGFGGEFSLDLAGFGSNNLKKYSVRKTASASAEIHLSYSGIRELSNLSKLRMAVFVLEKYNDFNSVCFSILDQGVEFELIRLKPKTQKKKQINLYIPDYTNLYLDGGGNLRTLYRLEIIIDYWVAVKYWFVRANRIIFLKIRHEIQRVWAKFIEISTR